MRSAALALARAIVLSVAPASADGSRTIVQMSRAFHPSEITVSHGESLTFSNHDDFIHQIYVKSDSMTFDSNEQPPGQNVSLSFPSAGTFEVRCHIHPRMSLIVHVN
jgi:plastocyanin